MTTGLWGAEMSEQRGAVAPPAEIDKYMVVLGCTSSGNTGLRGPFATARAVVASCGYGDACDVAGQVAEQRQTNGSQVPQVPVAVYELPATTAGAYLAIDVSGVEGTAVPTVDSGTPFGTYRAAVQIVEGCTVGTAGGTYRVSLEADPDWTAIAPKRLGTATSITIPNSGCGFNFDPPSAQVTAFIAAVTEARTDVLAHLANVTAHNSADTSAAQVALAASSAPSTGAEAWAVMNLIRAAYEAHRVNATVHDGADTTNAIALAAATNIASGVALYNEMDADYTAHIALGTGTHNSADSTNTLTSANPTQGTLAAGDIFFAHTTAPQPSAAAVDAAYAALTSSSKYFGIVAHAFNLTPTLAAHITTGLNTLRGRNKLALALAHVRMPDLATSETEEAWATSIEEAFEAGAVDDSRIALFASYLRELDARTTSVYRRSGFAQFCADVVRVDLAEPPCAPVDQAAAGLTLWTSGDVQVGHDEGPRGDVTGLSNASLGNRFVSTVSAEDPIVGNAVHYTVPWTLAAADDPIKTLMMRRVANAIQRRAISAAIGAGGTLLDYTAPDEDTPGSTYTLTEVSRGALQATIFNAISEPASQWIQNANDADPETGLAWVNPVITVAPGKLVTVEYEIRCRFKGVLVTLRGTFVTKE